MSVLDQTAAVMILYFMAMVAIGIVSSRRVGGLEEFHLAGRSVRDILLTATLCATIVGASATLGMSGMGFKEGLTGAWWLLSGTIGLLVLSLLFAHRIREKGCFTLPELAGTFYGDRIRIAASVLIIVSWIGVISAQISASGRVLGAMFGQEQTFMAAAAVIIILYTVLGGQHSVVRTDLVQFAVIITGVVILLIRSLGATGVQVLTDQSFPTSSGRDALGVASLVMIVGSTYLVGPDIYSRLFLARDPGTARRSAMTAALILVPLAFIITVLGICARHLFPDISPEQSIPVLMMNLLSPAERGIVGAALLAAFMSSAATPLMTATTTLAMDTYRRIRPESGTSGLLAASRVGATVIGMVALGLSLTSPGIIATILSVYTIFVSGMLVPMIAGFYKDRLGITSTGALVAISGGGLTALIFGGSYPLLGIAVSALLLISVSRLDGYVRGGPVRESGQ